MSLGSFDIVPANSGKPDAMRVLLHGPPGGGKSFAASTIAQVGKTLYVDMVGERGEDSFRGADWSDNIDIVRPKSVTELPALYKALAAGGHAYTGVILDSLTAVQKSACRWLLGFDEDAVTELKKGRAGPSQQMWGSVLEVIGDVCTFWYSLADSSRKEPMNVVFNAQSKQHEDLEGVTRIYPDVSKGSRSIAMATPNIVGYCDLYDDLADTGELKTKHVVHIGPSRDFATKARIPVNLHDKIPPILGLGSPVSLTELGRALGNIPPAKSK